MRTRLSHRPPSFTAATPPTSKTSTRATRADPKSVDAEWQAFFGSLKDHAADVAKNANGASWKKPQIIARDDTLSALDGQWAETEKKLGEKVRAKAQSAGVELSSADVQQATRDSIRALMLIRAYRIRGHFHANLDPLGLALRSGDEWYRCVLSEVAAGDLR